MRFWTTSFIVMLSACTDTTIELPEPADLILQNGVVITLDEAIPEAQAIAIRDHRIVAVGSNEEIGLYAGSDTTLFELGGATVIPGLIEGHGHYLSLGRAKQILDLTTAEQYEDIVSQVAQAVDSAEPGEWIFGRGWHQDKWSALPDDSVEGVPTNESLNRISPDNPVYLGHASGHAAFANDAALAAAGIDSSTAAPDGGTIVRDSSGRATGLLRENAQDLVEAAITESEASMSESERLDRFREQAYLAGKEALRFGITSFHDAGTTFSEIDALKVIEAEDGLPVRLYVMVGRETPATLETRLSEYAEPATDNDFLVVRSIKQQIDGALGAHGAWLLEPYEDMPDTAGLVLQSVEAIERASRAALAVGFQVNVHAIGTRANRETLDLYERVWAESEATGSDLRWRIEHAQHIHPEDIPRFGKLGVIAAIQGVHCTSDGPWIPTRLGAVRTEQTSYRWRDLIDSGARINNGTDAPVESLDPFASLHASVARRMANGERFYPEQAMSREEALRSYTIDNAFSAFEEDVKGTITPGKYADLAVLSGNPLTVSEDALRDLEVQMTLVGGQIVYELDRMNPDR